MIHAITGRPGGGKSLHAVRQVCAVLRENPTIRLVTNLPLRIDALNEALQGCNVPVRVRLLSEDEVREFWRFRGQRIGPSGEPLGEVVGTVAGEVTTWPEVWPVVYILDEAHVFFNARDWAKIGRGALWYLSQHRHLGDTVFWISQYYGNVDKQFRVLTQDWTVCDNWITRRYRGFSLPRRYRVTVSLEPPDSQRRVIIEERWFREDSSLYALYDTTAGAGLPGGLPPEPKRRRGPHIGLGVALALVGVVVLAFAVPWVVGRFISLGARSLVAGAGAGVSALSGGVVGVPNGGAPALPGSPVVLPAGSPPGGTVDASRDSADLWTLTASVDFPDGRVFRAWESPTGDSIIWDGLRLRRGPTRPGGVGRSSGRQ